MPTSPLIQFDRRIMRRSGTIVGVDEAGRGALAGPVVAGAVMYERAFLRRAWCRKFSLKVNDSKLMTVEDREFIYDSLQMEITEARLRGGVGFASVEEIDQFNILGATRLAMERAIRACVAAEVLDNLVSHGPLFGENGKADIPILVDGRPLKPFPFLHEGLVKGDSQSFAIALASVLAKVSRDRYMRKLACQEPSFGWEENKGYGTPRHRSAILDKGPCREHREVFLRKILGDQDSAKTEDTLFSRDD